MSCERSLGGTGQRADRGVVQHVGHPSWDISWQVGNSRKRTAPFVSHPPGWEFGQILYLPKWENCRSPPRVWLVSRDSQDGSELIKPATQISNHCYVSDCSHFHTVQYEVNIRSGFLQSPNPHSRTLKDRLIIHPFDIDHYRVLLHQAGELTDRPLSEYPVGHCRDDCRRGP